MTTDELRQKFLNYFAAQGHKIYPSDSLIPRDDPTLLFTNAGMNQFKQDFLGKPTEFKRKASCQKCLRTDDLDKVGKTNFHHTFFEMLGNFSFGDYFKEEAIGLAWKFVSEELNLPAQRLWVSVYREDAQAYQIWRERIGLPAEKIVKLGAKENFWPANAPEEGPNGPCGPCSEIFYDLGKEAGCQRPECNPACSCGRFVEAWNLVFTEFNRQDKNKLAPLPHKNIDTGMGLERMAAVLQGVSNNFAIDIFRPITEEINRLGHLNSAELNSSQLSAGKAIADHIRAVTFGISDGALPSNDERGYVIRKLIRRAVWHGRALGIKKEFLYKIVPAVCKVMKSAYPELEGKREEIAQVVLAEEKRFQITLERAVSFAEEAISQLKKAGKSQLPGELAFKLYDTYGLPQEMLQNLVAARGLTLDEQGFTQELELQRKLSRQGATFGQTVFVSSLRSKYQLKPTKFIGDKVYLTKTKVDFIFKNEQAVKQAAAGENVKVVLEATPFYGESGGQVGDTGVLQNKNVCVEILDTQRLGRTIIHLGKVKEGLLKASQTVEAQIDLERRKSIARNHTATHLLQSALRKVLGEHVRQAGSWVGPQKLRFDFTHFQALNERQLQRVEEIVNQEISQNRKLDVLKMNVTEAQKMGALAFFAEKYEEEVRVIKIGEFSLELCGGTHVRSLGEIELFKIASESSLASGIRRIEAVTAQYAQKMLEQKKEALKELTRAFSTREEELPERIVQLLWRVKELERKLEHLRMGNFRTSIEKILQKALQIQEIKVIIQEIESAEMKLLRLMADLLKEKATPAIVVLASIWEERALLVCALSKNFSWPNLDAVKIIQTIAKEVDGSGGGRPDFAQAGGWKVQGVKMALIKAEELIKRSLNNEGN